MKNTKVLEMLNKGEIEQLKALLTDEIYQDSLKNKGNAKSRYSAMKRYFKYIDSVKEMCKYPCTDTKVNGEAYNSFCDGYCFALTKESVGEMEVYDNSNNTYLDMNSLIYFDKAESIELIDFEDIMARAKSKGYKHCKAELDGNKFEHVFKYKDTYYRFSFIDRIYSIINDGNPAEVYYVGNKNVLLIKTSIGIAGVLPFRPMENVEQIKKITCVNE